MLFIPLNFFADSIIIIYICIFEHKYFLWFVDALLNCVAKSILSANVKDRLSVHSDCVFVFGGGVEIAHNKINA